MQAQAQAQEIQVHKYSAHFAEAIASHLACLSQSVSFSLFGQSCCLPIRCASIFSLLFHDFTCRLEVCARPPMPTKDQTQTTSTFSRIFAISSDRMRECTRAPFQRDSSFGCPGQRQECKLYFRYFDRRRPISVAVS